MASSSKKKAKNEEGPAESAGVTIESLKKSRPDYNPRKIDKEELDRLRKSFIEFGDLSGIILNRRTGNLVGGNQRSKILPDDAVIEKTDLPSPSRTGTVATGYIIIDGERYQFREVDWDLKREKQANIAANAHGGQWDEEKLGELIKELAKDPDFDADLIGFDSGDLFNMYGEDVMAEQPEQLIEMSEKLREVTQSQEQVKEKMNDRDDTQFYVVAVFRSYQESKDFLAGLGLPDNRFVDGKKLFRLLSEGAGKE